MKTLEKIISSGKRIIGISLLAGALAINPLVTDSGYTKDKEHNKKIKQTQFFDLSIAYESPLTNKIENVPLEVRNLIKSPYSLDEDDIITIEENNVRLHGYTLLNTKLGEKISFYDAIDLNLGIGFDFNLGGKKDIKTKDNSYMSFTNKKGDGKIELDCTGPSITSVYYYMHPAYMSNKNGWLRPNLFSEIEFKINEKIGLVLGYKLSQEKIVAENGWKDSWNDLEKNKIYNLMDLTIGRPYSSLRFDAAENFSLFLDFGLNKLIKKKLTNTEKQIGIDLKDKSWFIGAGFRVNNIFQENI